MIRGTFANIRLRNQLVPGVEGGFTRSLPDGEQTTIFDAATKYASDGVPLMVIAGADYGSGSSRDWAAKGTFLLGVKAVIGTTGFSDAQRKNPVAIGTQVTYRFRGLNDSGIPRFASFMRVRED